MRVAINGFGRIGRAFLRIAMDRGGFDIVHLNDLGDPHTIAHLLKYDSTYGTWPRNVTTREGQLVIDDKAIPITGEPEPSKLPWRQAEVDVVLESSGQFRKREQAQAHLDAGARKVLISAPGKSRLDGNFVPGVNDDSYDKREQHIISIGSCTTNCLAPLVKVLHQEFTIERGLMTTVHAYTSTQNLIDGPHKDLRRARSAAENIIPTTTGAAKAISDILPELEGKLNGLALRVPVSCGSIVDLTCDVGQRTSAEEVNQVMRRWATGPMKGILGVTEAPLVSRDVLGTTHSAILTPEDTLVQDGKLVKVLAWYDNEWGFSSRCVDMVSRML